ncbi:hypothetical protein B0H13DRAFT_2685527 [Mycena leptocephala]|nr:hypothetical protein B0H13DRAFT_2685527 [Mycena leptocephala]
MSPSLIHSGADSAPPSVPPLEPSPQRHAIALPLIRIGATSHIGCIIVNATYTLSLDPSRAGRRRTHRRGRCLTQTKYDAAPTSRWPSSLHRQWVFISDMDVLLVAHACAGREWRGQFDGDGDGTRYGDDDVACDDRGGERGVRAVYASVHALSSGVGCACAITRMTRVVENDAYDGVESEAYGGVWRRIALSLVVTVRTRSQIPPAVLTIAAPRPVVPVARCYVRIAICLPLLRPAMERTACDPASWSPSILYSPASAPHCWAHDGSPGDAPPPSPAVSRDPKLEGPPLRVCTAHPVFVPTIVFAGGHGERRRRRLHQSAQPVPFSSPPPSPSLPPHARSLAPSYFASRHWEAHGAVRVPTIVILFAGAALQEETAQLRGCDGSAFLGARAPTIFSAIVFTGGDGACGWSLRVRRGVSIARPPLSARSLRVIEQSATSTVWTWRCALREQKTLRAARRCGYDDGSQLARLLSLRAK